MEHLRGVASICHSLGKAAATARRSHQDELLNLLEKHQIIEALNIVSEQYETKKKKDRSLLFPWLAVFESVKECVWEEVKKAASSKGGDPRGTMKKKVREATHLVQKVVRKAKKGSRCYIKGNVVVKHILLVMQSVEARGYVGAEHTDMLLKDVLNTREILMVYLERLKDKENRQERTRTARVVYSLIATASLETDITGGKTLEILCDICVDIKHETTQSVAEHLLKATTVLCTNIACDNRAQICSLGENIADPLLVMWNKQDRLKTEIIIFFQLMMIAHHPHGAKTKEEGAFAVDWKVWKSFLGKLYGAIDGDLQKHKSRSTFSNRENANIELSNEFVCLAVDLFAQLLSEDVSLLEFTQISENDEQPSKKRRMECGWDVFTSSMSEAGATTTLIPWSQFLVEMIRKYPRFIPERQMCTFLELLQKFQALSKKAELSRWILKALRSLARCQHYLPADRFSQDSKDLCKPLWEKVWSSTLRTVSLSHADNEGFLLLSDLVRCQLVMPSKDVWLLFIPGKSFPTDPALVFLASVISHYSLPEKHTPNLLYLEEGDPLITSAYPLRMQLLRWLLGETDEQESRSKQKKSVTDIRLKAQLLVALTLRDPQTFQYNITEPPPERTELSDIADCYLKTTFNAAEVRENAAAVSECVLVEGKASCVPEIQRQVTNHLRKTCQELLQITQHDSKTLESAVETSVLVIIFVQHVVQFWGIPINQILKEDLCEGAKKLMDQVAENIGDVSRKTGVSDLSKHVNRFCKTLDWEPAFGKKSRCGQLFTRATAIIFGAGFIQKLLQVATETDACGDITLNRTTSTQSRLSSTRFDASVFADEFDDVSNTQSSAMDTDPFEDEIRESTELVSRETSIPKGAVSPLSEDVLPEKEQVRLQIVTLLCRLCQHNSPAGVVGGPGGDAENGAGTLPEFPISAEDILTALSNLTQYDPIEGKWSATKPFDLHMAKRFVEGVGHLSRQVSDLDIEDGLTIVMNLCKLQNDQLVHMDDLLMLGLLMQHLNTTDVISESGQESRKFGVQIFSYFWENREKYVSRLRLIIAQGAQLLIKADPVGEWALWAKEKGNDRNESLKEKFTKLLCDENQAIRLAATEALPLLFSKSMCDKRIEFSRNAQDDTFDQIYNDIADTLAMKQRDREELEIQDEKQNRISTMLHTFKSVALNSPACEKKALYAICHLTRKHKIDTNLVVKVLKQVSNQLGYTSVTDYMNSHLPFLVNQWLSDGQPLKEFTFKVCGYQNLKTFYSDNYRSIVPFTIMRKSLEEVQAVSRELQIDWKTVLGNCLPKVLVHILPHFAVGKDPVLSVARENKAGVSHATACYDMLLRAGKETEIQQCIMSHLETFIVDVLLTLYDPEPLNDRDQLFILESDPEPNPPHYQSSVINATLEYLVNNIESQDKRTLVQHLINHSQDCIQEIMLRLRTHFEKTRRSQEKCRILLIYRLFLRLLLDGFRQQHIKHDYPFILRDSIYTLLHSVQKKTASIRSGSHDERMVVLCVDILQEVCKTAAEVCPKDLNRFLSDIVNVLVPLATGNGNLGTRCLELLNYLLVACSSQLEDSIRLLDPLPDKPRFNRATHVLDNLQVSGRRLKKDIELFLESRNQSVISSLPRVEGLRFLQKQLQQNKAELAELITDCDDSSVSIIQRLVQVLISVCRAAGGEGARGAEVAQEAARCLGEIGPGDLAITALRTGIHHTTLREGVLQEYRENIQMQNYCKILHMLDECLLDQDIDTVNAASEVLKQVLSTKSGHSFANDYRGKTKDLLFKFLHPFRMGKKKVLQATPGVCSTETFARKVGVTSLLTPDHSEHTRWIQTLVTTIIESRSVTDEILRLLTPVCKVKVKFCELILPMLVHDILKHGTPEHKLVLSDNFTVFFERHCGKTQNVTGRPNTPNIFQDNQTKTICTNKESVQTMLSVIQYLRCQRREPERKKKTFTHWDDNFWLEIDYLQVAKAAQNCSAYFTTLMYSEIWCYKQRNSGAVRVTSGDSQSDGSQCSLPGEISHSQGSQLEAFSSIGKDINVQDLMLEAHRCIGDPDGLYGCGAGRLADRSARIHTYEHENTWDKAVGSYDIQIRHNPSPATELGLLQALQNFGTSHVLDMYLQGLNKSESPELREFQYQAAWKNCNWRLNIPHRQDERCNYHHAIFNCLNMFRENDHVALNQNLFIARERCIESVNDISLESMRSFYPVLGRLACVSLLEQAADKLHGRDALTKILKQLDAEEALLHNDFDFIEPLLLLRCSLMSVVNNPHQGASSLGPPRGLISQLELVCKLARDAGRYTMAERALAQLEKIEQLSSTDGAMKNLLHAWHVEEAMTYWVRHEQDTAKHIMKDLLKRVQETGVIGGEILLARCLGLYGTWLAETRADSPSVIMDDYLKRAVEVLAASSRPREGPFLAGELQAHMSLARFADAEYQRIVDHMNSPTFEAKRALIKKAEEDITDAEEIGIANNSRYVRILRRQADIDINEIYSMTQEKQRFLTTALENYSRCLQKGETFNMRIFRLMSMWIDNSADDTVNRLMERELLNIKSYKFIPMMYQLAARMAVKKEGDTFQPTLQKLIRRCVTEHPHHCLPVILALAHAKKDEELAMAMKSKKSRGKLNPTGEELADEERIVAAKGMISAIKGGEKANIVIGLERLCEAYIELANADASKHKEKSMTDISIPSILRITKIQELRHVLVPTVEIPIDPGCQYANIVYVSGFGKCFRLAGGINLPKIIDCIGSDGVKRRQLVKGRDDLRQDAVMQQVFGMVNNLLKKDKESRKRQLSVRTYKIVPLSQTSGLLEWCNGTMPIGDYLIKSVHGAHERYRPNDWTAADCRRTMNAATGEKSTPEKRYSAFIKACKNFQPVFRYFFLEKFHDPTVWYERKLAYTRSVATTSIVGYILGLGDRHVQNILIDCSTAELVHIDLGVAFEQGRILPTPETIPFRLTRDIVDGMGVAGVEGVFRRSCEKTMEVMHQSHEALITILQVLLYDPIHDWMLSPIAALRLQNKRGDMDNTTDVMSTTGELILDDVGKKGVGQDVNQVAERVLLRLKQKLRGVEDGVPLSVRGQVNHLIQEARDPHNLSKVFPGWQPYI